MALFDTNTYVPYAQATRELTLAQAREIPLIDRNQEELAVTILHETDLSLRREALRLFKLDILQDAELRVIEALSRAKK